MGRDVILQELLLFQFESLGKKKKTNFKMVKEDYIKPKGGERIHL